MKVVFISNFLNHHQTPFCNEMVNRLGEDFKFISTMALPTERKNFGYDDFSNAEYSVNAYLSEEEKARAKSLCDSADVVIFGDAPEEYIENRIAENKLTFRYSERYFKKGRWHVLDPRVLLSLYKKDYKRRNKNLFVLCAGAYVSSDMRFIRSYPNKTFKWGYFPEVKKYKDVNTVIDNKIPFSILWAGRLISWKHPEDAIYVAERLKSEGYNFELTIVGSGELEQKLEKRIMKKRLQDQIRLFGSVSQAKVRSIMEKSEIFIFTSDRQEGWGAVLSEAMNSACTVVANKKIGSVPYLIKDEENGLIYKTKKELYEKVKSILIDKELKKALGTNAYETMNSTWNAEVAAERLITLIEKIENGEDTPYLEGPCSRD